LQTGVNVKDRNSAVIFVPGDDKLVQFRMRIDAVEESLALGEPEWFLAGD
jgi:predicted RNA-binding protein with TRAM domain